jgi:hypothetical protein
VWITWLRRGFGGVAKGGNVKLGKKGGIGSKTGVLLEFFGV